VELLWVQVFIKVFQCPHYGKLFPSDDTVISLGFAQCLNVVSYDTLLSALYLGDNSSNSDVTGVCVQDEPFSWLGVSKNRGNTQGSLEGFESLFYLWSPLEGLLLLSEFGKWFYNITEPRNKPSVTCAYAQKDSNFVLILRCWPFSPSFQFLGVGGYLLRWYNMPKVP
jgi:hypothetical protein